MRAAWCLNVPYFVVYCMRCRYDGPRTIDLGTAFPVLPLFRHTSSYYIHQLPHVNHILHVPRQMSMLIRE